KEAPEAVVRFRQVRIQVHRFLECVEGIGSRALRKINQTELVPTGGIAAIERQCTFERLSGTVQLAGAPKRKSEPLKRQQRLRTSLHGFLIKRQRLVYVTAILIRIRQLEIELHPFWTVLFNCTGKLLNSLIEVRLVADLGNRNIKIPIG